MGNRGVLHNEQKQIVKNHTTQGWVICALQHKGIKRQLMSRGRYTELFFLDEATALAAGHRPCNDCLKEKSQAFKQVWIEANQSIYADVFTLSDINRILHKERYQNRKKVTFEQPGKALPDGCMVQEGDDICLIYGQNRYRWSFDGYKLEGAVLPDEAYTVLTPKSIVRSLAAGYQPDYHPSLFDIADLSGS